MSDDVIVSGSLSDFVAFRAPSGQWETDLDAFLTSFSATFGFNLTPHKFSLSFVPRDFNGASGQLPNIGTYTEYEIRPGGCNAGFCLAGNVTHADYENSTNGTAARIEIQDRRKEYLDQVKVTTEDLGLNIPSGVVSVAAHYRKTTGFKNASGVVIDSKVKEYRNIVEIGASYQQIYEALIQADLDDTIAIPISGTIPHPSVVAANVRASTEPLRFKLLATPLSEAISAVLSDAGYDWYWGMKDDQVKVVNRKSEFIVTENSHPLQVLSPDSVNFKFGKDEVNLPGKVRILGAHQEGVLNSRLLSDIDGIEEPTGSDFTFVPAWTGINISFYDAFGVYRTYKPTETELQAALKSIEHWAYYKQEQVAVFGHDSDDGVVAAQHPTFQSRLDPNMPLAEFYNDPASGLRLIDNRNTDQRYWVLEWFARVSNHANNHYGRTYVLEGFSFNPSGEFRVIDAAWCNLENQRQDPTELFGENYTIDNVYAPITPFVTQDFKVSAHAVMPSSTVYGPEGLSVPASFSNWNEDAAPSGTKTYEHFIPVTLKRVGQKVINPRDEDNAFEDFSEGSILAEFPIVMGSGTVINSVFADLTTLFELGRLRNTSGIQDIDDPARLIKAFDTISGIAVPVQVRERYGQKYPEIWTSGNASGTRDKVIVDDKFAPWNFFPIGKSTSLKVMSNRASGAMEAELIGVSESRFAEITKTDWPFIGFDGFANQSSVSGMYGTRDHGVTEINVNVNDGVPTTRYGIKSYFAEFGKEAPLGERNFGVLNSIIHPIDFAVLNFGGPGRPLPDARTIGPGDIGSFPIPPVGVRKEVYAVTITQVFNRGSTTEPERYFSVTKDGVPKPGGAVDPLDNKDLICRDGFFNVGDHGLYVVEYKSNGARRRYYTGGTDLTQGAAVVEVTAKDTGANSVNISYRGFNINSVKLIPGASIGSITVGESGSLQTDGTMRPDNDGEVSGLRPDTNAPSGVYYIPVTSGASTSAALPVIITAISSPGTSGAVATVQPIIPSGGAPHFVGSGATTGSVRPIPFAEFAQSGDIGVYTQNAGGDLFVFLNRQAFDTFIG